MKVSLRLFAGLHDLVGKKDIVMELPEGARVADLKARLADEYPIVRPMLRTLVFAIDDEYIPTDEELHDGAEVSLIPPVSGGAEPFWLTADPLEPRQQELFDLVRRDECGAVIVFYGVVRNNAEGRAVLRLEYEAHETMAVRKMREVADEVKRRFPDVVEIGIWHRTGLLEVGETSLLVALSSPHRREGFEAALWAVDRIKEVVPVWKKEHFADGSAAWVEGHPVQPPETAKT
ncbi:MAG TPA: molybdenum cofactor biosynthesis protein MoaE [Dehalococcoidia bacterium]|nr:molybdenum cofactor biosynthesis protein MoaE [Dehalococcoidia bacterium]